MFVFYFLVVRMLKISLSRMMFKFKWLCTVCIFVLGSGCDSSLGNSISQYRLTELDEVGAYRWVAESPNGIRFQFVQRIPDQTRSFYLGRGFPAEAASRYATACIFQTILNNDSTDKVVKIDVSSWRIIHNDKKIPIKLERDWQETWEKINISKSARIAFRWSQFPAIQEHKPGDWFQGMTAASLPPGTEFDLYITWSENEKSHEAIIHGLQCADDRKLEN